MVAHRRSIHKDDVGAVADKTRRLCAATRAEKPLDELIRFVVAPDGNLVPDLARKLPGRGVWVTGDRETLTQAIGKRAFARSLKQPVDVPPDLPDQVVALLQRRCIEALSLANKAGQAASGFDKITGLIDSGSVCALAHASDAARDGAAKLDRKYRAVARASATEPIIITALDIDQMSLAFGRSNVVHAALMTGGAAERFITESARLVRFRTGTVPDAQSASTHNL